MSQFNFNLRMERRWLKIIIHVAGLDRRERQPKDMPATTQFTTLAADIRAASMFGQLDGTETIISYTFAPASKMRAICIDTGDE
jgi:hypothetical protein